MSTHIQWTDETLNVVTGCTRVSDGCDHCYIERTPPFRMAHRRFDQPGIGGTTGVTLHPDRLVTPLRWRKPCRIFVCSLADLFHDDVPDGLIAALWLVMGQCAGCIPEQYRGHTFQILTKRPVRMRAFLRRWADTGEPKIAPMDPAAAQCGRAELVTQAAEYLGGVMTYDWIDGPRYWPAALPNVWLGVSVENQQWADIRIPVLLDTPAAVRWISAEPLLGPVDLSKWLGPVDWPECWEQHPPSDECSRCIQPEWSVCGGESGPGSRPMHPDWARSLRDQCVAAKVSFFFKQHGDWVSPDQFDSVCYDDRAMGDAGLTMWPDGRVQSGVAGTCVDGSAVLWRVGKKRAGRVLDGRTWNEYPGGGS
jgi:protein gp37